MVLFNPRTKCFCVGIEEKNGDNILAAAIWFRQEPVNEAKFEYIPEPYETLEIIDSSDDEEEIERKTNLNEFASNRPNLYKAPVYPDDYFTDQNKNYNEVFDELLDIGLDYEMINKDGRNLVHLAVKRNNLHAFNKLIYLGVDPLLRDNFGNTAMHFVNGIEIFRKLCEIIADKVFITSEKNIHIWLYCTAFIC